MPRTGRPREFDEDTVVEDAKQLFWTRGYGPTSVQDLVDELGLARASLYSAFGDKRGLFHRALDRYVTEAQCAAAKLADNSNPEPVLPQIRALLLAVLSPPDGRNPRGCLLGNTTVELAPADLEAVMRIRAGFAASEQGLAQALQRARDTGEIPAHSDVNAQARMLLAVLQGLQILAQSEPDPARLADTIEAALAAIRATPAPDRPTR